MKKSKKIYKSKCCNAPVKVEGLPDFEGDKYSCTVHYVCTKCNNPCDIKGAKKCPSSQDQLRVIPSIKKGLKEGRVTKVKNLFARFLDAIFTDAKKHPEKLHTSDEVWDEEFIRLLDRPAKEIPKLKKLYIESIKRGIMDLKKGKYVSVKDLDRFFKEL